MTTWMIECGSPSFRVRRRCPIDRAHGSGTGTWARSIGPLRLMFHPQGCRPRVCSCLQYSMFSGTISIVRIVSNNKAPDIGAPGRIWGPMGYAGKHEGRAEQAIVRNGSRWFAAFDQAEKNRLMKNVLLGEGGHKDVYCKEKKG